MEEITYYIAGTYVLIIGSLVTIVIRWFLLMTKHDFEKDHPYPDMAGIDTLFKFYKIDPDHFEYLSDLFIGKKLYHALPEQFNDPFECRPHFELPKDPKKSQAIDEHLINLLIKQGHTRDTAELNISDSMRKEGFIEETILNSVRKTYRESRICSFATQRENLLLWSHYTDSHKGFCIEFDAKRMPISGAYKVKYEDDYPEIEYPPPKDKSIFRPALIKSKAWKYEGEYRSIFVPDATIQQENDGESLILNGDEIKHVYFGVDIDQKYKEKIIGFINMGPFNPILWDANLSKSSFKLEFSKCC